MNTRSFPAAPSPGSGAAATEPVFQSDAMIIQGCATTLQVVKRLAMCRSLTFLANRLDTLVLPAASAAREVHSSAASLSTSTGRSMGRFCKSM
jgi:hypothetical protein